MKTKIISSIVISSLAATALAHEADSESTLHHAAPKSQPLMTVVSTGQGAYSYQTVPGFGKTPDGSKLGPTHGGVAVDNQGLIYVSTDGPKSICVFKPDGTYVKEMAPEAVAIHGMQIHTEGDKQFIYGAKRGKNKQAVKIDLDGNIIMTIPNKATGEIPGGVGGITGIAVAPDNSIFVSMGYGSQMIHKFDQSGKLLKSFGGGGNGKNQFRSCHGLGIDTRYGAPRLLVCDRENRRLVHLDLEGNWIGVHATGLRRPCAVSFHGDYSAVAELEARVAILDKDGKIVSLVGDNPNKAQWAKFPVKPSEQKPGIFTAPHGLSFDKDGNLYVQDWNATGRISKMQRVQTAD
ncbi:MAG: 6-bladed beta-propeller [Akkermansiaceae bacterium]